MITRAKTCRLHNTNIATIFTSPPTYFSTANKDTQWHSTMENEFIAIIQNKMWSLIPRSSHNIVSYKWVFKIKQRVDGSIERHKARLVTKGFHQQEDIDYLETFSLVVKHTTIRTILPLVATRQWLIHELDVNNVFLHGNLHK
ncbi:uncharacterized mitochondrial protein AtMg00820-like [Impatiens glandulifera]|uniref:uncharacterized mitochondrial protein AtMg00820-like n=1 Tax=Impatiens glandulifera TaxID=253017 RepID=UPI001FB05DA2|nr:uncharacterized mitochondrial protein AtMg00820-like [Impatiens glandulifera]